MLLWDFGHQTACSQKVFRGGAIYNFKAKIKWAILKIKAKMTLLQLLTISQLIMVRFKKKQTYSSGPPLSISSRSRNS